MLKKLDEQVAKMPHPEFVEVANNPNITFTSTKKPLIALTVNWQWVVAKTSDALLARQPKEVINLLVSDLEYVQLTNNAVNELKYISRQSVDNQALLKTQAQIDLVNDLVNVYINSPYLSTPSTQLDKIINESSLVVSQFQNLGVVGIGAFMIAAGFHLALLQEKAKLDIKQWSNVKAKALDYIEHAAIVIPKLFELSVGQIDKTCSCTKWKSRTKAAEAITEYECRYFDGKDIHIFREASPNVINSCNKHRLQMFHAVTDRVMYTVVTPIRAASKQWQELATSIGIGTGGWNLPIPNL